MKVFIQEKHLKLLALKRQFWASKKNQLLLLMGDPATVAPTFFNQLLCFFHPITGAAEGNKVPSSVQIASTGTSHDAT
ncbi:hypothetical protein, partial [Stenotrophomonas maltophilia]|uniref:hypothetical protein n=1 Tax=Stenotrophomonas maltophilia TaxID=40324 RepID=UPI002ACE1F16